MIRIYRKLTTKPWSPLGSNLEFLVKGKRKDLWKATMSKKTVSDETTGLPGSSRTLRTTPSEELEELGSRRRLSKAAAINKGKTLLGLSRRDYLDQINLDLRSHWTTTVTSSYDNTEPNLINQLTKATKTSRSPDKNQGFPNFSPLESYILWTMWQDLWDRTGGGVIIVIWKYEYQAVYINIKANSAGCQLLFYNFHNVIKDPVAFSHETLMRKSAYLQRSLGWTELRGLCQSRLSNNAHALCCSTGNFALVLQNNL